MIVTLGGGHRSGAAPSGCKPETVHRTDPATKTCLTQALRLKNLGLRWSLRICTYKKHSPGDLDPQTSLWATQVFPKVSPYSMERNIGEGNYFWIHQLEGVRINRPLQQRHSQSLSCATTHCGSPCRLQHVVSLKFFFYAVPPPPLSQR